LNAVPPKTVYLLGAGFSKPAGMPLATDLVGPLAQRIDHAEMNEWLASLKQRVEWLCEPGQKWTGLNIEQVFHLAYFSIEVHRLQQHLAPVVREAGETPWKRAKSIEGWLQRLEYELVDLISENVAKADLGPIARWASGVRETDVVATFNYDTLVERALESVSKRWNHGFESEPSGGIPVFKLHGSIDWIVADRRESFSKLDLLFDKTTMRRPVGRTGYVEEDCRLWRCRSGEQREKWIVGRDLQLNPEGARAQTPGVAGLGAYKELHRVPGLGLVWVGAMRAVQQADQLIVVGFSMSDFDTMAQMQLVDRMRKRHEEERPLRVLVIDPAAEDSAFQRRFRSVFHDAVSFEPQRHDAFDWRRVHG